jgi:hypothetical protein
MRETTVKAIVDLMFPTDYEKSYHPFLFFKAPTLSGKTGMVDLLFKYFQDNGISSYAFTALDLKEEEGIVECFERVTPGFSFERFVRVQKNPRVLILDGAQCAYADTGFWESYIKQILQPRGFPGLRIVMFASYGSFDPYGKSKRSGTPLQILRDNIFCLDNSEEKPGLHLTGEEFREMIRGSIIEKIDGLVWNLCSRHIGITYCVVKYICEQFKNKKSEDISQADLESVARSSELLQYVALSRGMPTLMALQKILRAYEVNETVRTRMENILEMVSRGKVVLSSDQDRTPGTNEAVDLLTRFGFLYEDRYQTLNFASSMHLKVWLWSSRKHPLIHLMNNPGLEDFVVASIRRMSASRLSGIARENDGVVRERQLQMEFYHALVSCVPKEFLITPEWRTDGKDGYVDLAICGKDVHWFLELLVDGDDAIGQEKRFQPNQPYHESLLPNSHYVLIDFRQNRTSIRKFRKNFIYVQFESTFKNALLKDEDQKIVTLDLEP